MNLSPIRNAAFAATAISFLLSACTPHPSAGNWQAVGDNANGIRQLTMNFDGKAEFATTRPENAEMHCFWGAVEKNIAALQCTASTNPDVELDYRLSISDNGVAELSHNGLLVASFNRVVDR